MAEAASAALRRLDSAATPIAAGIVDLTDETGPTWALVAADRPDSPGIALIRDLADARVLFALRNALPEIAALVEAVEGYETPRNAAETWPEYWQRRNGARDRLGASLESLRAVLGVGR